MSHSSHTNQRGFSLIELLIVVAIIGIVAAIAIPNYLASQQAAHTSAAIQSMRLIHSSEASYLTANGQYADLATLGATNHLNDPLLAAGYKSRYSYTVTVNAIDPSRNYEAIGTPGLSPMKSRHFFIDASGLTRFANGSPASAASQPLK